MAVFRAPKKDNYTIMSNYHFKERGMTLKAKGLLSLMLSLPDDWDYSFNGLVAICKESDTAVKSCLRELKAFGYLKVIKDKGKDGKFQYIYEIMEKPRSENPAVENPPMENPPMENPAVENRTQLITNQLNTDKSITKHKYKELESEFEMLWAGYPKKQGKKRAKEVYFAARKKGILYEDVKAGIDGYAAYVEANKIEYQYIKQGATFFSQYAWQDDWKSNKVKKRGSDILDGIL